VHGIGSEQQRLAFDRRKLGTHYQHCPIKDC
jgi:hypothetical protein